MYDSDQERNKVPAVVRWIALATGALLIASCGGGGYGGGGMSTPPPTLTLSIAPTSVVLGHSATLTWASNTGTSCMASGAWSGAQATSGTLPVTPTAVGTLTYTLTCSGGAYSGSTSMSVTLTVTAMASGFSMTSLVADTPGTGAMATDANVVNSWGIAFGPAMSARVANNHSGTSTLHDGNGNAQPAAAPLVVRFAKGAEAGFGPTGMVFNGTGDFVLSGMGKSGAARFIFAGEGGMIAGWSPDVDRNNAITVYADAGGAVYKGLTVASNDRGNFLYATDFHNGKIDVFDANFQKQASSGMRFGFADPMMPAGYAPFGIQAVANGAGGATQLYVTYAKQLAPDNRDHENGAGLGLLNVFDTNGRLLAHLVRAGGALNAPWGIALAPPEFGTLSKVLLIANVGDGRINGYDAVNGRFVDTLADPTGRALAVPGLRGIAFGNDAHDQPHNTLFYAAGTNNDANGVFGRIDPGGSAPVLNAPSVVARSAPSGGAGD
jgi:uncharacterized protein (TIGR03118 family)